MGEVDGDCTEPHLPKRRRVTRACDECRRKKIKCDGRMPCTHCTVYSYNCTFDQPSNRRRNPPVGYLEDLERKCEKYEQILQKLVPDMTFDEKDVFSDMDSSDQERFGRKNLSPTEQSFPSSGQGKNLESMLEHVLELNRSPSGDIDYRGHSSGSAFVHSVCGQLHVTGSNEDSSDIPDIYAPSGIMKVEHPSHRPDTDAQSDLSPKSLSHAASGNPSPELLQEVDDDVHLPPKQVADQLLHLCFHDGCSVIQFVHWPSFQKKFDQYYDTNDDSKDEKFLPILYAALAVGTLFVGKIDGHLGIEDPRLRAFQYFSASKRNMDDALTRANMEIIQTLLLQILFLQSTANIATCWTYIGVAMRCAHRLGLHRRFEEGFSPIERQLRKKIFWTIRNIEVFLHVILGLPAGIRDVDFDQSLPLEIDDQHLTESSSQEQPEDTPSSVMSQNCASRLSTIMGDIVQEIYSLRTSHSREPGRLITHDTLHTLGRRIDAWTDSLPPHLRHDTKFEDLDIDTFRASRLLRYCSLHAVILLYRPYLHYLSMEDEDTRQFRIYGERAKQGAVGILQVTEEIFDKSPTCFGHWYFIYAAFFSGIVLVYCVAQEQPENGDRAELLRYIDISKKAVEWCSKCSYAAEKCLDLLNNVSAQLSTQKQHPRKNSNNAKTKANPHARKRSSIKLEHGASASSSDVSDRNSAQSLVRNMPGAPTKGRRHRKEPSISSPRPPKPITKTTSPLKSAEYSQASEGSTSTRRSQSQTEAQVQQAQQVNGHSTTHSLQSLPNSIDQVANQGSFEQYSPYNMHQIYPNQIPQYALDTYQPNQGPQQNFRVQDWFASQYSMQPQVPTVYLPEGSSEHYTDSLQYPNAAEQWPQYDWVAAMPVDQPQAEPHNHDFMNMMGQDTHAYMPNANNTMNMYNPNG